MTEKRFKVAVYDDKAINGFAVLDLHKPNSSMRLEYEDVYLDIGEDKRCKYENTVICDKCAYYSDYFLDCRLMMEDKQYKKALELGLVKE